MPAANEPTDREMREAWDIMRLSLTPQELQYNIAKALLAAKADVTVRISASGILEREIR